MRGSQSPRASELLRSLRRDQLLFSLALGRLLVVGS